MITSRVRVTCGIFFCRIFPSFPILFFYIVGLFLCAGKLNAGPMLDLNSNAMSDVWEQMYGGSGLSPSADSDGDGYSNLQEALAGTDPLNPNSFPKISNSTFAISVFSVTIPVELGKQYQLQSITSLDSTNWIVETNVIVRSGTNLTLSASPGSTGKFFRTAVSDVDTDGDGLSDWEEYKLGLDPFNAASNGQVDTNGNLLNDLPYATAKIAAQNVFTIVASDPVTFQPDPGVAPTDFGMLTISRGGFPLNAVTVNLSSGGPGAGFATAGIDYFNFPPSATFPVGTSSKNISVLPLANTNLQSPVIAQLKLLTGTGYSLGRASSANVVIYPSPTPEGFGLTGYYYTNSSTTYTSTNNFNTNNLFLTRIDTNMDFTWGPATTPNLSNGLYSVRWIGQVQPQYTETYYFDVYSDDGCVLRINDTVVISNWVNKSASDIVGSIDLVAGVHYNLKLDYLQSGGSARCQLNWYSADQSKQVIPVNRLYPTNSFGQGISSNAPAAITSALVAYGFLGQPFSFNVTAANTPQSFTASNLPPGLAFNTTNGLISGTPALAGEWQVPLTASNAVGIGASVVDITIIDTGSAISREIWTNISGVNISDIPANNPADITLGYASLDVTNYGDNYAERIRGYFTAPATANYYFWIAGSDSAQLWISDDNEPADKILRCWITPTNNPTASGLNGTSPRQWNLQANQRSGWLALNAGQKYYLEILHKAGTATNDNWSVGWRQDPTGTNTSPTGVTPSYLLGRYFATPTAIVPGTLYTADLLALPGVSSTAVGSATLRVSADGLQAVLNYSFTGISGAHVDHIYTDPYLSSPTTLVYDIAAAHPQTDGSYIWNIKASGSLSTTDVLEAIIEGKCNIVIQTPAAYPAGEIGGHFTLASGSQTFTPPPAPPAWTDDSGTTNGAVRFLTQATFGASLADIAAVQAQGYSNWISAQMALPITKHLGLVQTNKSADPSNVFPSSDWFNGWWQNSVTAPDQLRQRVAFALSEIMVVSENGTLLDHADALAYYYDLLLTNSFGNFRNLMKDVSLSPAMGLYLNMQGNAKGSLVNGTHPNENYAREINQLFSIGLNRLWPDGSLILNSSSSLVPTYSQNVINGFAATFTGWNYFQTNAIPTSFSPAQVLTNQMSLVQSQHDLGSKLLLDNVTLPLGWGLQTNTSSTNFVCFNYCSADLDQALDNIFNHPNVGPFICRQLIQRLVTSNPSRGYIYRVAQKFNDNGNGVRGDMAAVIKAILLDYEARSTDMLTLPTYGKQREPMLRATAMARAFIAPPSQTGTYVQNGTQTITVTTPAPHRMNSTDTVQMTFVDPLNVDPAPPSQSYSITSTGTNTFTLTCPNLLSGTYTETNGVITCTISGHGLVTGNAAYVSFTTGGAPSGPGYVTVVSSSVFTMSTFDNFNRSGSCLLPRITANGFTQTSNNIPNTSGTNVNVSCAFPHGLTAGQTIFVPANTVSLPSMQYQVASIPDSLHFVIYSTNSANQIQSAFNLYPLSAPSLTRSGTATTRWSTWNLGYTDSSATYNLSQSPLSANTVFNFFFPDYAFPGALSAAGLTTPEFQLTSDTSVALQMNFLASGLLNSANNGNTNGLSSFTAGDGDIVLDIGPWMTTNLTSNAGVPALVDNLNSLLLAGQLSAAAKTNIVNYVTNTVNFPFSTPPTQTQIRDRVRAVAHLITCSPDFTIQK
jgi:hypothetical protein